MIGRSPSVVYLIAIAREESPNTLCLNFQADKKVKGNTLQP